MQDSNQTSDDAKPAARRKISDRLYLHRSGQYAKRIAGKVHYFGGDFQSAVARWNAEKEFLLADLPVPIHQPNTIQSTTADLAALCNAILNQKQSLAAAGALSLRTYGDYRVAAHRLLSFFGSNRLLTDLRQADFVAFRASCAANVSAQTCGIRLRYIRAILKYAYDTELVDHPIRFGKALALPSQSQLRAERNQREIKMFTVAEIRLMLDGGAITNKSGESVTVDGASTVLRAAVLLAINCGFGNGDIVQLTLKHIDLQNGWHNFPRPKPHQQRRCSLWPETVAAVREWLKVRPSPNERRLADRVFLTQHGGEMITVTESNADSGPHINVTDCITKSFGSLLNRLSIKRSRVGFYSLRRTHRTVSDETGDQPACSFLMGHIAASNDMASIYRQQISDARLIAVS